MKKVFILSALALIIGACSSNNGELRTQSGFLVEIHRDADGPTAKPGDYVSFHYIVSNGEETLFDSHEVGGAQTTDIPETTDLHDNTSAVLEALQLASINDSLTVYYPVDSSRQQLRGLEGKEFLIYHLVVTDIVDKATYEAEEQKRMEAAQATYLSNKTFLDETLEAYKAGDLDGQITELDSGLKILMVEPGEGDSPVAGDYVTAHYIGVMEETGEEFDNSYMRGAPFDFVLGRRSVIQGWDEGFAQLKKGAKATFFIPSALGYGERGNGNIPPNANLVFFVELVDVESGQ